MRVRQLLKVTGTFPKCPAYLYQTQPVRPSARSASQAVLEEESSHEPAFATSDFPTFGPPSLRRSGNRHAVRASRSVRPIRQHNLRLLKDFRPLAARSRGLHRI